MTKTKTKSKGPIKVDPKEWYSPSAIVQNKMFTWCTSFWSVRNVIENDAYRANILCAQITGKGRATKYKIRGENIIKFVQSVESGKVKL